MKKIAFTICCNNYLPQAQLLAESFKSLHPGWSFYIGLVDETNDQVDYSLLCVDGVVKVASLSIAAFESMWSSYSVVELSTAVKPFYFLHFFERCGGDQVVYIDPDIYFYSSLEESGELDESSHICVTPHALTPIPLDGDTPGDNLFLNHGVFNLGFLALKRGGVASELLAWWSERLTRFAKINLKEGFFTDQLWMNFLPIYFGEELRICRHPGFNAAYWNTHERTFGHRREDGWFVNEEWKLVFFHFSSFDTTLNGLARRGISRYTLAQRADLIQLYKEYAERIEASPFLPCRQIEPHYETLRLDRVKGASNRSLLGWLVYIARKMVPARVKDLVRSGA